MNELDIFLEIKRKKKLEMSVRYKKKKIISEWCDEQSILTKVTIKVLAGETSLVDERESLSALFIETLTMIEINWRGGGRKGGLGQGILGVMQTS